jgi:hypothetical protein
MIMAWKEQKCNIRRKSNNDHWITHPELPMAPRSEFIQDEHAKEEKKYQMLDLSTKDQQSLDLV